MTKEMAQNPSQCKPDPNPARAPRNNSRPIDRSQRTRAGELVHIGVAARKVLKRIAAQTRHRRRGLVR